MSNTLSALETRGRLLSLTEICVDAADHGALLQALASHIRNLPAPLKGMPVLLDCAGRAPVAEILQLFEQASIPVIGMTDRVRADGEVPRGFPVIPAGALTKARAPAATAKVEAEVPNGDARRTRIQSQPVRSGQQIYAEGGDLIVLAPVSVGAEVVADGSIHVYAPLRGRAIAGAKGDRDARVFCSRQEAELIAVAGTYAVAEQIQDTRGKNIQAYLDGDTLRIKEMAI